MFLHNAPRHICYLEICKFDLIHLLFGLFLLNNAFWIYMKILPYFNTWLLKSQVPLQTRLLQLMWHFFKNLTLLGTRVPLETLPYPISQISCVYVTFSCLCLSNSQTLCHSRLCLSHSQISLSILDLTLVSCFSLF